MFLVSDGSRENRKAVIEKGAGDDVVIKLLLSAIDFEWTLRRTILALGCSPTKDLLRKLDSKGYRFFNGATKLWTEEVVSHYGSKTPDLNAVISSAGQKYVDKDGNIRFVTLTNARDLRNKLVHGIKGGCPKAYGNACADVFLAAADALCEFANKHDKDIFKTIRRIKPAI